MVSTTKIDTQQSISSITANKQWYTEDEVTNEKISAYKMGKEDLRKEVKSKVESDLKAAQSIAQNVYFNLRRNKVFCKEIKLRKTTLHHYEAIFIIPEKDYLSPENYSLSYEIASQVLTQMSNPKTCFSFLFMPKVKSIDQAALISDGFYWTFKNAKPA